MIVALKPGVTQESREQLMDWLQNLGLHIHVSEGEYQTILGLVGDTTKVDMDLVASLDIVDSVKRVTEPFKCCNRKFHPEDTVVQVGDATRISGRSNGKINVQLILERMGGGGRFDPGILYYMPQIWTSDDTDAYERTKIQYGTSIVYPPITMGAHVAACHGRLTPLSTRGNVAMSGNLGYELDLTKISEEEKEAMRQQVALYKEIRQTVQFGDFYRIVSPFDEPGETGWIMVSQDKSEAFAVYVHSLNRPTQYPFFFRLKGLDPAADYLIDGKVYGGDELMQIGLTIPPNRQDFSSHSWVIRKQ